MGIYLSIPRELPMMASHILLSDLNIPVLKNDSFFGRERLLELHINASQIHTIHSKAFNTCKNLQVEFYSEKKIDPKNKIK